MPFSVRYALSSDCSGDLSFLFDTACTPPWEYISTVIMPLSGELTTTCPICLDVVRIPRVSKCLHIFW